MNDPRLSVDPDAAFEAVAHDQVGGPYQIPAEFVRLAVAFGAGKVEVECRRGRVAVEAQGAVIPVVVLEALRDASGHGDGVARLQALGVLEDHDASALGWAVGTDPRRLEIRAREGGQATVLTARGRSALRLSSGRVGRADGLSIELMGPKLSAKRAVRWLEIACRFANVAVIVNGRDVRRELDSGSFCARIARPLPATVALGVELASPRLWLLRHGVVASRVGVPDWPPFEAAVEMEGLVKGWASAAHIRQAVTPFLSPLISRALELALRVVPRLPELSAGRRRCLASMLLKAADRGLELEAIRRSPLLEVIDVDGSRWVSLEDLKNWPGRVPGVLDKEEKAGTVERPHLLLGLRDRERVAGLIGRTLPTAVITRVGPVRSFIRGIRAVPEAIRRLIGPGTIADEHLREGERKLIEVLGEALTADRRPIIVCLCRGRKRSRVSGRRLLMARDRAETRQAVAAISNDPAWAYVVAMALKAPDWEVSPSVRSAWRYPDSENLN